MSRADDVLFGTFMGILKEGEWDVGANVRPRWEDGIPAYTIKKFGVVNRYDLRKEFPIASGRKVNYAAAIDELLWIWQKKSNNVKDLCSGIWDQWANKGEHPDQEIGSIGKAYGFQLGDKKIVTKTGEKIDQVDYVLHALKHNPASRRIITNIFEHADLHEMNLQPCAYSVTFNVTNGTLNMLLHQRSNDTLTAGSWNVVQYAALLCMMAQVSGYKPGEMVHVIADAHIYDKHVPMVMKNMFHRCSLIQKRLLENSMKDLVKAAEDMEFVDVANKIKNMIAGVNFEAAEYRADEVIKMQNVDYIEYLSNMRETDEFEMADRLINRMLECPVINKALGFSTPKLKLDETVSNFYDFQSPKCRASHGLKVENGKFVREAKVENNPKSSFIVEDYHPEIEGVEFDRPIPVAE